jgi:hypothetical protein
MKALVYRSVATSLFKSIEIDSISREFSNRNKLKNISGLLIYHKNYFFQWIEGDDSDIYFLYQKIKKDNRHQYFSEIFFADILERKFKNWGLLAIHSETMVDNHGKFDHEFLDSFVNCPDSMLISKFISISNFV